MNITADGTSSIKVKVPALYELAIQGTWDSATVSVQRENSSGNSTKYKRPDGTTDMDQTADTLYVISATGTVNFVTTGGGGSLDLDVELTRLA